MRKKAREYRSSPRPSPHLEALKVVGLEVLSRPGPLKAQVERWPIVLAMRNWEYYLAVVSHDANIDALKRTRRSACKTHGFGHFCSPWRCGAALAFFLIEVWQIVEFCYSAHHCEAAVSR